MAEAWRCFDDVAPVLAAVRDAKLTIAVASNFDARLHTVCDGLPELRQIDVRVISSEVGYCKPSPQFYAELVGAIGVPADQILMVGDDHTNDVDGALAAGLRSVHLNRQGAVGANSITRLFDLAEHLD